MKTTHNPDTCSAQLPSRAAILGAGISSLATARYLHAHGAELFISDAGPEDALIARLHDHKLDMLEYESGGHSARVLEYECIVVSPGIAPHTPILQQAREKGIELTTEIDLACRVVKSPILAVTGTSGKTSVVTMTEKIGTAAGIKTVAAGNIGTPLISCVDEFGPGDLLIVEISSFQLEYSSRFAPAAAAVLNIGKNHLDWHDSMDSYIKAKKRIAAHFGTRNVLVLNHDDPILVEWGEALQPHTHVVWVGSSATGPDRVQITDSHIVATRSGESTRLCDVSTLKVPGAHNRINACVAAAMCWWFGIAPEAIADGLQRFGGLPHRIELVREKDGVAFFDDSKATTAESVRAALECFDVPVCLIAGGRDKGCDFSRITDTVRTRVAHAFLIGEAAPRIESEWQRATTITRCASLQEAVCAAAQHAALKKGVVLLSPGCSSFDMFDNYKQRGERFAALVHEL